jgi:hypothetical protein
MNARSIFSVFLVLVILLIAAGCTQPTPPVTPTPTAVETMATEVPTPVPTTLSLTPGPTQMLPDMWSLEMQVQGNGEAINPLIVINCQGGKGLNFIQRIDAKVTRPDGVVETNTMTKPLYKGKEMTLPITSQMGNVNRVEIWATTPEGNQVKIYDDYVPFRTYN